MKNPARFGIGWVLALAVAASGCATRNRSVQGSLPAAEAREAAAETKLVVGLYPYVPRLGQFRSAISEAWAKVQPSVPLTFLSSQQWDGGYSTDPPPQADVFVFDAMFFDYFRSQGWLEPMKVDEIDDLGDFVAYAIEGVKVEEQYFAIPQLGCANILFYLQDDLPLAAATTLSQIKDALNQCTYTSEIPPDRRGLMVDLAGGTTNADLYLDAVNSITGQYPPPLPWNQAQINQDAISNVRLLLAMASYRNGSADPAQPFERGMWFSQGWGRALIGYTEAMSVMSPATLSGLGFKVMPLSDDDQTALFYADVIGVSSATTGRGTRELAVQLANLMASSQTMLASIGPDSGNPYPQFLMATRPSVFRALASSFPIYKRMYGLIEEYKPVMFKINARSRDWLTTMKDTIRIDTRKDYPCGCDYPAVRYIVDDAAALPICTETCSGHGGWSGRWTNQYPAAPAGTSVCSCNACPAP